MTDIIATIILVGILGGAIFYVVRAKKSGAKCVGCPHGKTCGSKNNSGCGCGCGEDKKAPK